jgi:hypothetical protein
MDIKKLLIQAKNAIFGMSIGKKCNRSKIMGNGDYVGSWKTKDKLSADLQREQMSPRRRDKRVVVFGIRL